jgi:threonine dehydratase
MDERRSGADKGTRPALVEIASAQERLRGRIVRTPLRRSDWLSRAAGMDVWLKLECVQLTGSFKIRGALNAAILHAGTEAFRPRWSRHPPATTAARSPSRPSTSACP